MTALARRTSAVPIELTVDELPPLGGMERDIIGIAQEALTNAVALARAKRIAIHAAAVRAIVGSDCRSPTMGGGSRASTGCAASA